MITRVSRARAARRGVAATETAFMLPILVLVVFGSIELANGIYLKQALSVAAYEGARALSRAGAPVEEGEQRIAEVLAARSITEYDVTISPAITPATPRGTEVSVSVTAPGSTYSIGPVKLFEGISLTRRVRMVRL